MSIFPQTTFTCHSPKLYENPIQVTLPQDPPPCPMARDLTPAILVKTSSALTYAEAVKRIKVDLDPTDLGPNYDTLRKTQKGNLLLKFKGGVDTKRELPIIREKIRRYLIAGKLSQIVILKIPQPDPTRYWEPCCPPSLRRPHRPGGPRSKSIIYG